MTDPAGAAPPPMAHDGQHKDDIRLWLRHGKGIGVLWSGAFAGAAFGFLAQVLLARSLGPAHYGVIVSANAVANLLGPMAAFGIGLMLVQKHAQEGWRAQRWVAPSFRFVRLSTLVASAVFIAWALTVMPPGSELLSAIMLLPLALSFSAIQLAESRFQLEHNYSGVGQWHVYKHALLFLAALVGATLGLGLIGTSALIGLGALALAAYAFSASLVMVRETFTLQGHGARTVSSDQAAATSAGEIFDASWPFAVSGLGYLFLFQASLTAVQLAGGNREAGIFGLAISIVTAIYLLPRLLYQRYFLARVSRWYYHEPKRVAIFASRFVPLIALLSAPLAVVFAICASTLLPFVFGHRFAEATPVMQILSLAIPFRFLSTGLAITAVETDQVKKRAGIQVAVGLAAALAMVLALPSWGIAGAAAIVVAAEIGLAVVYWLLVLPNSQGARPPAAPTGIA